MIEVCEINFNSTYFFLRVKWKELLITHHIHSHVNSHVIICEKGSHDEKFIKSKPQSESAMRREDVKLWSEVEGIIHQRAKLWKASKRKEICSFFESDCRDLARIKRWKCFAFMFYHHFKFDGNIWNLNIIESSRGKKSSLNILWFSLIDQPETLPIDLRWKWDEESKRLSKFHVK